MYIFDDTYFVQTEHAIMHVYIDIYQTRYIVGLKSTVDIREPNSWKIMELKKS